MAKKKFDDLTRSEQRVEIAKDVLKQIYKNRFVPTKGTYVRAVTHKSLPALESDAEVCDIMRRRKCEVCALGALFLSAVDKHDNLKVSDLGWRGKKDLYLEIGTPSRIKNYLEPFFTSMELLHIEQAFENYGLYPYGHHYHEYNHDPVERMTLVMTNIVNNNGDFIAFDSKGNSQ